MAGWKCIYVPKSVVYHHSSAASGKYSPLKAYLVERNRLWVLIKYFPLRYILLSPFYTILRWTLQLYGALAGKGAAGRFAEERSFLMLAGVFIKAYFDAVLGLPVMIKKRLKMAKIKRTGAKEFALWLKKFRIGAAEIALKE